MEIYTKKIIVTGRCVLNFSSLFQGLTTEFLPRNEVAFILVMGVLNFPKVYALLTKREVKMAGYWPSSFLRFYGPRRSRGP